VKKNCDTHGDFETIIWRDKVDMESWRGGTGELRPGENANCPDGCAGCMEHIQGVCCVLLEVTGKCNLKCEYCFAGELEHEPDIDELKRAVEIIMSAEDKPLLQFSGGEPSLRDDLPELISHAREMGCEYTQLNSNGLRLANDEAYVEALARAGLSFVFMQFDGVCDRVYEALRGRPLFAEKLRAIEMCDKYNLGVTLVPTIVRGVNDGQIGDIIKFGASLSPAVRGIHFQPVAYLGRYPGKPENNDRVTLDELLSSVCEQTDIDITNFSPSRCDHPFCGFHGSFISECRGLRPLLTGEKRDRSGITAARDNRNYVGQRWRRDPEAERCCRGQDEGTNSLDGFLGAVKTRGFTITAMAFQDAMNLDIERLRRCSLRVYDEGILRPFCAKYLSRAKAAI